MPREPMIEKAISHYRVLQRLGGGGMGVVYKAEDTVALVAVDQNELMLYDFTTKKWAKQAEVQTGWGPNWSRDGRYIYLDDISSATEPVFVRMRISDGRMERVASLKGLRRAYGPFGTWAGLTPDDAPLVLRDTGSQEIYALDWEAP